MPPFIKQSSKSRILVELITLYRKPSSEQLKIEQSKIKSLKQIEAKFKKSQTNPVYIFPRQQNFDSADSPQNDSIGQVYDLQKQNQINSENTKRFQAYFINLNNVPKQLKNISKTSKSNSQEKRKQYFEQTKKKTDLKLQNANPNTQRLKYNHPRKISEPKKNDKILNGNEAFKLFLEKVYLSKLSDKQPQKVENNNYSDLYRKQKLFIIYLLDSVQQVLKNSNSKIKNQKSDQSLKVSSQEKKIINSSLQINNGAKFYFNDSPQKPKFNRALKSQQKSRDYSPYVKKLNQNSKFQQNQFEIRQSNNKKQQSLRLNKKNVVEVFKNGVNGVTQLEISQKQKKNFQTMNYNSCKSFQLRQNFNQINFTPPKQNQTFTRSYQSLKSKERLQTNLSQILKNITQNK